MKLTLSVNHRCNLRCSYCYTGEKFHRPMSLEVAQRAVDFGLDQADQGFLLLCFFGGEPLLELALMEQVTAYAKTQADDRGIRLSPSVATNGTLLDARRLRLLEQYRFAVQVSLDGCAPAHDATRPFHDGRPSHSRVARNLQRLLAAGFRPCVIAVIDPANVAHLGESFDYLLDLGAHHIYFAPNYSGNWDEAACDRLETALRDLADRYIARFRAGQDVRLDPLNGKVVTHLNRGHRPGDLCKFGEKELAVAPSGRIYPCDRLVGQDEGTVSIGDLDAGIDEAKRDALVARKNKPDAECAACPLQPRCTHWCGCANFETTGDVGRPSPALCWFQRCFIAEADRVANILFAERNPTFIRRFYVPQLAS